MKILVVDDEKLLVKGIKFNLENEGYTVDACYDGEEAVAAAHGRYDLIILDLMMPKKDGLQACQEIRSFFHGAGDNADGALREGGSADGL